MLSGYRDGLRDLFIVSEVAILGESEIAELKGKANGNLDFRTDGLFGRVSAQPPIIVIGQRAPGRKCQRCWMYYDDDGDPELCPRCRAVVRV
ncbi:MAG: zinc finger domain-containing protein [Pseudomonadota bacterium]